MHYALKAPNHLLKTIMKPLSSLLIATALVALPATLRASDEACCPAAKAKGTAGAAECCPASKATANAKTEACAAKGQTAMLKIKNVDAAGVEKALKGLDGVAAASTCSESKFTKVSYDGQKVCTDKIMAALAKAGYKVETQRVTYAVDGMACGACASKVSKALSQIKGVSDAKVCHEAKQAVVDFDPAQVNAQKVLAAIDATGFKATESVN